ncbi:DsbA family protein [Corallococcus sp. M34]|uniref:DsbA family protein n=1 Tax=Citreicoccus inhibens TaxID=2849499 RepID=UPI001C23F109|nr:thioredoxin domain-containing protein [Citreicoccus inhibens]MBU8896723.1 DsbA family protein [Citreicoccus inhibens]
MRKYSILGLLAVLCVGSAAHAEGPTGSTAGVLAERPNDIVLGRPSAPVTLVAYLEYHHLHYEEMAGMIETIASTWPDDVRLVVRDFPMEYHGGARLVAMAAHGVYLRTNASAYLKFVSHVSRDKTLRDVASLSSAAQEVGAGPSGTFEKLLSAGAWEDSLQASRADIAKLGISASPTWFLNGVDLKAGFLSKQVMQSVQKAVNDSRGKVTPPAFVPGKGIGPFSLGQSLASVQKLGLRSRGPDTLGWMCVATDEGSDLCVYRLRIVAGKVHRIDYSMNLSRKGLKVGSEVFTWGSADQLLGLRKSLGCGETESMEGGASTTCQSPTKQVTTKLSEGDENECSEWTRLTPPPPCKEGALNYRNLTVELSAQD